jgi:hypothetical protein
VAQFEKDVLEVLNKRSVVKGKKIIKKMARTAPP